MNLRYLITLFLGLLALAFITTGRAADFEHGLRPPGGIYDPGGVLDQTTRERISNELEQIRKNEDVEILIVVLPTLDGAPPEFVAGQFAKAWAESTVHAVVLHVPDQEDSPWIVPHGKFISSLNPTTVSERIAEATRNVRRETTDSAKVQAAATETSDMLRYWLQNAINRTGYLITESSKLRQEQEANAKIRRLVTVIALCASVPILVGLWMLRGIFKNPGPKQFPEVKVPRRLGAPHCGGNHCVVTLGPIPSSKP